MLESCPSPLRLCLLAIMILVSISCGGPPDSPQQGPIDSEAPSDVTTKGQVPAVDEAAQAAAVATIESHARGLEPQRQAAGSPAALRLPPPAATASAADYAARAAAPAVAAETLIPLRPCPLPPFRGAGAWKDTTRPRRP